MTVAVLLHQIAALILPMLQARGCTIGVMCIGSIHLAIIMPLYTHNLLPAITNMHAARITANAPIDTVKDT